MEQEKELALTATEREILEALKNGRTIKAGFAKGEMVAGITRPTDDRENAGEPVDFAAFNSVVTRGMVDCDLSQVDPLTRRTGEMPLFVSAGPDDLTSKGEQALEAGMEATSTMYAGPLFIGPPEAHRYRAQTVDLLIKDYELTDTAHTRSALAMAFSAGVQFGALDGFGRSED